jgi:hypothetical protein
MGNDLKYPKNWNLYAVAAERSYGTWAPAELLVALAILESGWGASRNARELNNPFNIKAVRGQPSDEIGWRRFQTQLDAFASAGYLLARSTHYIGWRAAFVQAGHAISNVKCGVDSEYAIRALDALEASWCREDERFDGKLLALLRQDSAVDWTGIRYIREISS